MPGPRFRRGRGALEQLGNPVWRLRWLRLVRLRHGSASLMSRCSSFLRRRCVGDQPRSAESAEDVRFRTGLGITATLRWSRMNLSTSPPQGLGSMAPRTHVSVSQRFRLLCWVVRSRKLVQVLPMYTRPSGLTSRLRLAQNVPTLGTYVPGIDASPVPVPGRSPSWRRCSHAGSALRASIETSRSPGGSRGRRRARPSRPNSLASILSSSSAIQVSDRRPPANPGRLLAKRSSAHGRFRRCTDARRAQSRAD